MEYAEAQAAFFAPRQGGSPPFAGKGLTSPARRLRDAVEPLAMVSVWSEPAHDRWAALGLDFLGGYVRGRAAALGEPDPSVVAAVFGVFEPGLIAGAYDESRRICGRADALGARQAGAVEALRACIGDPEDLAAMVAALRRAVDAADTLGRPLAAGEASLPWPDDLHGQLWHACTILRELRGDGHLAACATAGVTGLEANLLTEAYVGWEPFTYAGTRGWSAEQMTASRAGLEERGLISGGALTVNGFDLRGAIEVGTELSMERALAGLGADLDAVVAATSGWSQAVIDRGWFPPDPYKRLSG